VHWEILGHAAQFSQLHAHGVYFVCTHYPHNHWRSYSPPLTTERQCGPEINSVSAPNMHENSAVVKRFCPSPLGPFTKTTPHHDNSTRLNINLDFRHQLHGMVFTYITSCICARVTCIVLLSAQLCRCLERVRICTPRDLTHCIYWMSHCPFARHLSQATKRACSTSCLEVGFLGQLKELHYC
jgi:hypothetical protein